MLVTSHVQLRLPLHTVWLSMHTAPHSRSAETEPGRPAASGAVDLLTYCLLSAVEQRACSLVGRTLRARQSAPVRQGAAAGAAPAGRIEAGGEVLVLEASVVDDAICMRCMGFDEEDGAKAGVGAGARQRREGWLTMRGKTGRELRQVTEVRPYILSRAPLCLRLASARPSMETH